MKNKIEITNDEANLIIDCLWQHINEYEFQYDEIEKKLINDFIEKLEKIL